MVQKARLWFKLSTRPSMQELMDSDTMSFDITQVRRGRGGKGSQGGTWKGERRSRLVAWRA